jgi:hypothetical protein
MVMLLPKRETKPEVLMEPVALDTHRLNVLHPTRNLVLKRPAKQKALKPQVALDTRVLNVPHLTRNWVPKRPAKQKVLKVLRYELDERNGITGVEPMKN